MNWPISKGSASSGMRGRVWSLLAVVATMATSIRGTWTHYPSRCLVEVTELHRLLALASRGVTEPGRVGGPSFGSPLGGAPAALDGLLREKATAPLIRTASAPADQT